MQGNNSGQKGNGQNTTSNKQPGLSWSQPSTGSKPVPPMGASANKITPMLKPAPMTPAPRGGRKSFMLFVGGIVVGGLLAWSWFSLNSTPMEDVSVMDESDTSAAQASVATADTKTPTLPGSTIGNEALVVPSPQDAGLSVTVSSVTVNGPTWVVVYESQNGVRGNALGAALMFPDGNTHTINLLRATMAGKVYLVGRHVDNGDKQFSLTDDQAVVNAAGNPAYVEFKTR